MSTIQEIIDLVSDLNDEAIDDSKQDVSNLWPPFKFDTNGDDWAVDFLGQSLVSSNDSIDADAGETWRSKILMEARKLLSTVRKYRLKDRRSQILSTEEDRVHMLVVMEATGRFATGVNINEAIKSADAALLPSIPGWDCENVTIIDIKIIDSK